MNEEFNENLSGLEFKIEKYEESSLENGEKAFIIYLVIDNKVPKNRTIKLSNATFVTHNREQIEQDLWLSGYLMLEDSLKSNSFKKAGLIFYKSKLKAISDNDILYVPIELPHESMGLTISFKRENNKWNVVNIDLIVKEIIFTPRQLEKILQKKIEKLEVFEEKLNINIEKLTIRVQDEDKFNLLGEIQPRNGLVLSEKINLFCVIYDKQGGIILQRYKTFYPEDFYGFEIFDFSIWEIGIINDVGTIRIYPKKY